jgi:hypothetical protein
MQPDTTTIIIKRVPRALWRKARSVAAGRGETMRAVVIAFLTRYAK